jgi:hypothetical protein
MWALPRVWRRKRFIVYSPLVGDPARIWIASSQIAVRMLQFSYVDVRRRRSDRLRQRHPGCERMQTGISPQHPATASLAPTTVKSSRLGA